MDLHCFGLGLGCEHAFLYLPDISRGGKFYHMSQNFLRERRDNSTEYHLILQMPMLKFWILDSLSGTINCNGDDSRWSRCGFIKVTIEKLPLRLRLGVHKGREYDEME